jgi:hypothetical protein
MPTLGFNNTMHHEHHSATKSCCKQNHPGSCQLYIWIQLEWDVCEWDFSESLPATDKNQDIAPIAHVNIEEVNFTKPSYRPDMI